jgi:hypothetical protein
VKNLFAWLTALTMIILACRYIYQIWQGKITPTLSTWIIFMAGTSLSLITYALAENRDFKSGILSVMDTMVVASILCAIIIWGKRGMRFKSFEKWYLAGIAAIIVYGVISGDAWGSNIFTQVLITIGYIPTAQSLMTEKRNTESLSAWGLSLSAGVFALYPALVDGNSLAALYSIRTIVLVSGMLCLMAYYEFIFPKKEVINCFTP